MRQQLENLAYESRASEEKKRYFTVGDLEYLSATALYGWAPKPLSFGPPIDSNSFRLHTGPRGFKILDEEAHPLIRLDYPQQGKNPPMHLQYGGTEKDGFNPERSGEEAVDIFSHIVKEHRFLSEEKKEETLSELWKKYSDKSFKLK